MINQLIEISVKKRWLVVALTLVMACVGLYNATKLPIDAVPDITNIQIQINTEAAGYSPLEVEQRITYLVENAMAGVPNLDYTRSLSRYGLSQVTVIFKEKTDIYWARQQVTERIQTVQDELPKGITPELGPIASGLGEIFTYAISAEPGALNENGKPYSAEDLRTIQDWIVRPQLVRVPGVTEINSIGGFERQYQVAPIPGKMLAYKITIQEIVESLERNNQNAGAGYIERNGEQWLIRSQGQLSTLDDIGNLVVVKRDDAPVRIKDVAVVSFGKELRTGAATYDGRETVLGTAFMLLGENSRTVSQAVADKLESVKSSLPQGIQLEALYNRTTLVEKTLKTVRNNLLEGALLVITVLFLLLGNIRAAMIAALVIPLSMLFSITGMAMNKVSGNLMSLGAIDFGLIVDGAVIVVENALRRLNLAGAEKGRALNLAERLTVVTDSTKEVIQPAVFGVAIIMLVFLPIFALSGVEGKMFHPMAFTLIAALFGALILSITFVPAAVALLVKGTGSVDGHTEDRGERVMNRLKAKYQTLLDIAMAKPVAVLVVAAVLVVTSAWQATRLGSEFLPQLDEHDIALHALRIPGTSLAQSVEMQNILEQEIRRLPEVKRVFAKIGTPEVATDPMPPNVADTFLILKERSEWPDPDKSKAQFINELREVVEAVPGNKYEFTQPIEMRFNELIAGVRSDVAIRIYGDDLDVLASFAEKAEGLLKTVAGAQDVRMEQATGLPMITVTPDRDHMGLLGLSVADVQQTLQFAVGGIQAGQLYEGDKRFPLFVRLDDSARKDVAQLAQVPVMLPLSVIEQNKESDEQRDLELRYVPLGEIAHIEQLEGPNQINRQLGKRNIVVTANVEGRDLGSFVNETQALMESSLGLPAGYWLEYGGTFEQLQSASQRLSIVVPLTLLLILGLLFSAFNSLKDALTVFSAVPLALTGGVLALTLRDMPLSISAAVGFIALSGVAVLNGVVMLSFIKSLREAGMDVMQAIQQGASQRLRPVIMTALVASLGFVPMALNTGTGAEVQRPLATVVIGGIVSSTLLTLFVLPVLYRLVNKQKAAK